MTRSSLNAKSASLDSQFVRRCAELRLQVWRFDSAGRCVCKPEPSYRPLLWLAAPSIEQRLRGVILERASLESPLHTIFAGCDALFLRRSDGHEQIEINVVPIPNAKCGATVEFHVACGEMGLTAGESSAAHQMLIDAPFPHPSSAWRLLQWLHEDACSEH